MNRFLALTLVAAGGATLFGCKNTVNLNTGGSTATSTHATVTAATGTTVTGTGNTATNTTGALVGSTTATGGMTQCQSLCDFDSQLSTQLGCAPQGAMCVTNCEALYTMAPQCASKVDALISCGEQQGNASTCMCDTANGNSLKCNVCMQQVQDFSMCLQGSSTSSGMTAVASSSNGGGGG